MDYFLRFEQASFLWFTIPGLLLVFFLKFFISKTPFYHYTFAGILVSRGQTQAPTHKVVFNLIRSICLLFLALLIAKPQLVDRNSNILIEGIDIVLALDLSDSMRIPDNPEDQRTRFAVAKEEALRFVNKRTNDPIGLVIFGNDALSRVPLTLDKKMITEVIESLEIGIIDRNGTVLSTALLTAINRLKNSRAKSKIIILLTDGAPSEHDIDPQIPIHIAQKLGIKIYTIGIGSDEARVIPFGGIVPGVNKPLLTMIAQQTGGKFFLAHNAKEMRTIYNTIDALEKTKHETNLFSNYLDIFVPFVWGILVLLAVELILRSTIWFGI